MSKYELSDVAQEVAQTYGAHVMNYYVRDDTLTVVCVEDGEVFNAELKLDEIDDFMSM